MKLTLCTWVDNCPESDNGLPILCEHCDNETLITRSEAENWLEERGLVANVRQKHLLCTWANCNEECDNCPVAGRNETTLFSEDEALVKLEEYGLC